MRPVFSWCETHLRKERAIVFAPLPGLIALLVALAPVRDLLFCAKYLFVEAIAPWAIDHGKADAIHSACG